MIRPLVVLFLVVVSQTSAQLSTLVADYAVSDVTGQYVYRPRIALHPTDGSVGFSWGDDRYGGSSAGRLAGIGDIFAAKHAANGSVVLNDFKVGDVKFGFFSDFSMYDSSPLLLANGAFIVSYHVDARTTVESIKFDDVYYSAYASNGAATVVDKQLNMVGSSGSGYGYRPAASLFGSDFIVAYRYYLSGVYHIGVTTVNGTTGALSGDAAVIDDATGSDRSFPQVTSNGTRTVVVWADTRTDAQGDIYLQAFQGTSASGSNTKVNDDVGSRYTRYARAAMNASGRSIVVWIDTRANAGGDLYAQIYDNTGAKIGGNIKLTSSNSSFNEYPPAVGMDASGNFVIAWADSGASNMWSAKTRAFAANGTALTGILELTSPATESIQPDLVMSPAGVVTYAWLDGRLDADKGRIFSKVVQMTATDVKDQKEWIPGDLVLDQNFPNPFNPSTNIRFHLTGEKPVRLSVIDLLGREVAVLLDDVRSVGTHTVTWHPQNTPSGAYITRLQSGTTVVTRMMVLQR